MIYEVMPAKKKVTLKKTGTEKDEASGEVEQKTHLVSESDDGEESKVPVSEAVPSQGTESSNQDSQPLSSSEKTETLTSTPLVSEPAIGDPPSPPITPPVETTVTPEAPQIVVNTTDTSAPTVSMGDDGGKKKKIIIIALVALVVLGLALGGYYVYTTMFIAPSSDKKTTTEETPVETTPSVEETVTEELDLTKYPIEVLNGTDKKGEAAKLKSSLEEAGFVVSNVGNAASSDFELTEVATGMDVPQAFIDKLIEELGKTLKLASEAGKLEDEASGVTVTIGVEAAP